MWQQEFLSRDICTTASLRRTDSLIAVAFIAPLARYLIVPHLHELPWLTAVTPVGDS